MLPRQDPSTAGHLFAPHEEGMSPTAVPPHGDPGREGKLNLHVGTSSISAFCHRFAFQETSLPHLVWAAPYLSFTGSHVL